MFSLPLRLELQGQSVGRVCFLREPQEGFVPGLQMAVLLQPLHVLIPLCTHPSGHQIPISSFYKATNQIVLRSIPTCSLSLNHLFKGPVSKHGHILRSGVNFNMHIWGWVQSLAPVGWMGLHQWLIPWKSTQSDASVRAEKWARKASPQKAQEQMSRQQSGHRRTRGRQWSGPEAPTLTREALELMVHWFFIAGDKSY